MATDLGSADVVLVWLAYHDVRGPLMSGAAWPDPLRAQLEAVVERAAESWDAFFSVLTAVVSPHGRILVAELGIPLYLFDRFGSHPDWAEIRRLAYLDAGRDGGSGGSLRGPGGAHLRGAQRSGRRRDRGARQCVARWAAR
jgi:hypothetical protein